MDRSSTLLTSTTYSTPLQLQRRFFILGLPRVELRESEAVKKERQWRSFRPNNVSEAAAERASRMRDSAYGETLLTSTTYSTPLQLQRRFFILGLPRVELRESEAVKKERQWRSFRPNNVSEAAAERASRMRDSAYGETLLTSTTYSTPLQLQRRFFILGLPRVELRESEAVKKERQWRSFRPNNVSAPPPLATCRQKVREVGSLNAMRQIASDFALQTRRSQRCGFLTNSKNSKNLPTSRTF